MDIYRESLHWKYYIPLYLIFFSLLLLSSRDFQSAQASPIALSNIHRIICILLEIAFILYYFIKLQYVKKPPKTLLLYGFYIFIGFISALVYSSNFLYDLWKLIELLSLFLLGIYIWSISKGSINIIMSFFDKIIFFIKFLLLSVIFSVLIDSSNAIQYLKFGEEAVLPFRIQGTIIIINALSVGTFAAIIFYYNIIDIIYNKQYRFLSNKTFWILSSGVLLITSQSRTSVVGVILSLFIYFFLINKMSYYKRFFLSLFGITTITFMLPSFLSYIQRGNSSEVITSLSGRTEWWSFAWNKFLNGSFFEQLVGFGFASAERKTANDSSKGIMNTLDSTYFSSLISTGLIGTIILVLLILYINIKLLKRVKTYRYYCFYTQLIGFTIILTLKTFTTGTVNILTAYSLFFIFLILLVASTKNNPKTI